MLDAWQRRASTDPTLIERWWGRTPEANIAVATGPGSRIFVLMCRRARRRAGPGRARAPSWCTPEPIRSSGPAQGAAGRPFLRPDGREIRNSAGRLGRLDTRGAGGFCVLPPSLHPSGNHYAWAVDREPWGSRPSPAELADRRSRPAGAIRTAAHSVARAPKSNRRSLPASGYRGRTRPGRQRSRRSAMTSSTNPHSTCFVLRRKAGLTADAIAHGLEAAARHAGLDDWRSLQR